MCLTPLLGLIRAHSCSLSRNAANAASASSSNAGDVGYKDDCGTKDIATLAQLDEQSIIKALRERYSQYACVHNLLCESMCMTRSLSG